MITRRHFLLQSAALLDIHDHYDTALLKVRKAMNFVETKATETTSVIRKTLDA